MIMMTLMTEVIVRLACNAIDGCVIFLHFLLGALVLPVGLDHPAHDEDVGAARVELAVVGESHPELPLQSQVYVIRKVSFLGQNIRKILFFAHLG